MRLLTIEGGFPLRTRNVRLTDSLKRNGYDEVYHILWNREKEQHHQLDKEEFLVYQKPCELMAFGKKLLLMRGFYRFIKKQIEEIKPDLIIASHWDTLFLTSLIRRRKNQVLLYENHDMPTHSRRTFRLGMRLVELNAISRTDGIILASRFFKPFYKKVSIVVDNKPLRNLTKLQPNVKNDKLTIGYFGTIRHFENFVDLLSVLEDYPNIDLLIAGRGPDKQLLLSYLSEKKPSNVKYLGNFEYADLPSLYAKVNIVWSVYPGNTDYNMKFATPNKFFEAIAFNKPVIMSADTKFVANSELSRWIIKVKDYTESSIRHLFEEIARNSANYIEDRDFYEGYENTVYWEEDEHDLYEFIESL